MALLCLYLLDVEVGLRNQGCVKNQSLNWIAIDKPGGHYANPVYVDFTTALKRRNNYSLH